MSDERIHEQEGAPEQAPGVGELAELYLGNLLYALELAAMMLTEQGRGDDAGFYRGIARKLAEARGRDRKD